MAEKIIIAGSRSITDYQVLLKSVANIIDLNSSPEIVSGGARGIDALAYMYARENNLIFHEFKPQYRSNNDRGAPLRRNVQMANFGDRLVAIWNGQSLGTKHMIDTMAKLGKPVHIYMVQQ